MGGAVFPPCYLTWDQTMVEVMKIMSNSFKRSQHALLHSVPPALQPATANPCLHWRLLDTHRQVWVNLLWGHCSFLLGPGAHKVFVWALWASLACMGFDSKHNFTPPNILLGLLLGHGESFFGGIQHSSVNGCSEASCYFGVFAEEDAILSADLHNFPWTNSQKRCPFYHRRLEYKCRKSRDIRSNRQIWLWSTEWSRAKANRVLSRECTGHSKHPLPTTHETTLHMDITRWSTPKSDWLYSLQSKMEKLYTVSKNKSRRWLWLRSWTPYCQIQP